MTQESLSKGEVIKEGIEIGNEDVSNYFKTHGKIEDWNKMRVKIGKEEVHYYQNSKTKEVYYDKDYKTKLSNDYLKGNK